MPGIFRGPKYKPQPRVTGDDIPEEIWRIIAGYLAQGVTNMGPYISVNLTFYNFVLGKRYGEVRLVKPDKRFLHLLKRLREPLIAQHVRTLYIRAWFVQYLLKRDALFKIPADVKAESLAASSSGTFMSNCRRHLRAPSEEPQPTSREIIQSLITAVQGMINVTKFSFEWTDLPLNNETRIFLTSPRKTFATSLRKLVLRAQISKFKELLAITDFDNLDELNFHFDCAAATATEKTNRELLDTIVPFISHRQSALRSLTISSSSLVDLSEFFKALPSDALTNLRSFTTQISFNEQTLSDPSGILRLLKLVHPFCPMSPSYTYRTVRFDHKDGVWRRLNDKLLSHSAYLSSLESLEMPFVTIEKTIPLLHRSSETLTRLRLSSRFLVFLEVSAVLSVFAHRQFGLQHLHLEVASLDLFLLDELATRLPGLSSLILVFESSPYEFQKPELRSAVVLSDWKLSELEVYSKRYQPPSPEGRAMSSIAESAENLVTSWIINIVPSIRFVKSVRVR
ncbi:hypothetical protein CPB84DRAFT_1724119 [Gymnopilus junonius]|uniref:Uncharacterized protein n=1 Tax=Gymnopilus junonius TaxID=109634 RepID=A0A9P5TSU2_GYMJU|nr:hypothetical protein CPB84DRAFT_1724119 [Gymnopilus junonius]